MVLFENIDSMFEEFFAQQRFEDDGDFLPLLSVDEEEEANADEIYPETLPLLALKNTVLFPGIVIPITVGRDKSIKAINRAYEDNRYVAVLSQRDSEMETPKQEDLFRVGTVARILKLLRMPDGTTTAILQGRKRFALEKMTQDAPYMEAKIQLLEYEEVEDSLEFEALTASILERAQQIIELSPNIPSEANMMLKNINNTSFLLNFIASNLGAKVPVKQNLLEMDNLPEKGKALLQQMNSELQLLELKDQIENKVRVDIEKQQRDYFLNQQLKTIQEELGQNPQEEEINNMLARAKRKSGRRQSPKPSIKRSTACAV